MKGLTCLEMPPFENYLSWNGSLPLVWQNVHTQWVTTTCQNWDLLIHKVSWAYFSWKKWWILIYTILIVIFISVTLCQADFTHSWYDYCATAGSSRVNASTTPAWGWGAREEEVRHCTFILDAKLTMVRCFSLFCWAVLSSGRLSLLAAQSHPPQKSRHKIKLELLYGLSSPTPHTKSTIDSLLGLCTYSWSKCSTSNSCLLQETTYSWRARHECTNAPEWNTICALCDIQPRSACLHWQSVICYAGF